MIYHSQLRHSEYDEHIIPLQGIYDHTRKACDPHVNKRLVDFYEQTWLMILVPPRVDPLETLRQCHQIRYHEAISLLSLLV